MNDRFARILLSALCVALICMPLTGCGAGIALHETPQIYDLSGEDPNAPFFQMPTVTLYKNGNGQLSQPPISSTLLLGTGRWKISGDELTISYGDNTGATFTISNNGDTLTLKSASISFAKIGAVYKYRPNADYLDGHKKLDGEELTLEALRELANRAPGLTMADFDGYARIELDPDRHLFDIGGEYTLEVTYTADGETVCVLKSNSSGEIFPLNQNGSTGLVLDEFLGLISIPKYKTQKWLDYLPDFSIPDKIKELTLTEFPGVTFTWTPEKVTAGDNVLFYGMPVWNVFLTDLTNDGSPEFCATVSMGSGIVDTHVFAYDYLEEKLYVLQARMEYDYHLSMDGGSVTVTRTDYSDSLDGASRVTTQLRIVNGALYFP